MELFAEYALIILLLVLFPYVQVAPEDALLNRRSFLNYPYPYVVSAEMWTEKDRVFESQSDRMLGHEKNFFPKF